MQQSQINVDAIPVKIVTIDPVAEQMNQVKARAVIASQIQSMAQLNDIEAGKLADAIMSKCNEIRDLGPSGVGFDPEDFGIHEVNFVEADFLRGVQKVAGEYAEKGQKQSFAAYEAIQWAFWLGLETGAEAQREFERRQI
jgi:hypothetical protein